MLLLLLLITHFCHRPIIIKYIIQLGDLSNCLAPFTEQSAAEFWISSRQSGEDSLKLVKRHLE